MPPFFSPALLSSIQRDNPLTPAKPAATAATSSAATTPEPDTNGFETWADWRMMDLGGQKMTGGDGKLGFVFKNGKSEGEMRKQALAEWQAMGDSQRRQALAKAKPARIGEAPPAAGPFGQSEAVQTPGVMAPSVVPNSLRSDGGNLNANATYNAMGRQQADRVDSARAAVQRVQQQQRQQEDAAMGVNRTASGSVVTAGGGVITPTGNGNKVLASGYGSGSVTQAQPGQVRAPAVFYGTNKGDSTPMSFAQATGKAPVATPAITPTATAPPPSGSTSPTLAGANLSAPVQAPLVPQIAAAGSAPATLAPTSWSPATKPVMPAAVTPPLAPPTPNATGARLISPLGQAMGAATNALNFAKSAVTVPPTMVASNAANLPAVSGQLASKAIQQAGTWLTTPRLIDANGKAVSGPSTPPTKTATPTQQAAFRAAKAKGPAMPVN